MKRFVVIASLAAACVPSADDDYTKLVAAAQVMCPPPVDWVTGTCTSTTMPLACMTDALASGRLAWMHRADSGDYDPAIGPTFHDVFTVGGKYVMFHDVIDRKAYGDFTDTWHEFDCADMAAMPVAVSSTLQCMDVAATGCTQTK
jgi:hypothetical protein